MKANELYFLDVLLIMPWLKRLSQPMKSLSLNIQMKASLIAVISCGAVYCARQDGSNF